MPTFIPAAPHASSQSFRRGDESARDASAGPVSDQPAVPFEQALVAADKAATTASGDSAATGRVITQRQSALGAFEQGVRRSKMVSAACEQELQQSIDHSQASIEASKKLAGAQPAPVESSTPVPQESDDSPGAARSASAREGSGSQRSQASPVQNETVHTSVAGVASVHGSRAEAQSHAGSSSVQAAQVRGVAGTTQTVGGAGAAAARPGGGESVGSAAGAVPAGAAMQGSGGGGATGGGGSGGSGEGNVASGLALSARGSSRGAQAKAKPFASLMQAARPEVPEATMVIRTSKALAQALRNGGDLKLDLSPEQLGRIQVRMTGTEAGMEIVLACHEPRAVDSLERSLPALRRSLEEQGVHAASMRVCVVEGAGQTAAVEVSAPGSNQSATGSPFEGDADAQGRRASAHDRPGRSFPMRTSEEGEQWEVDSRLGTVIASVSVAGMSRAVDVTV